MSVNLPPKGGPKPVPNNVVRLPIGDHGYTRGGKRERKQHEHSVGYGTEEFDIIDELTVNREQYIAPRGEEGFNLSMIAFPDVCSIAVDVIRAKLLTTSNKVGVHPVIACCVANGVAIFGKHDDIRLLLDAKDRFDCASPDKDGDEISLVSKWLKSFGMETPSDRSVGIVGDRQNAKLPLDLGTNLQELARELGSSAPVLGVITSMITLSMQPCVNRDHRKYMSFHVERFMRRAHTRTRVTKAILDEFEL